MSYNAKIGIFYATHDGHSRRIAERIKDFLSRKSISASLVDMEAGGLTMPDMSECDMVALVSAVRYGRHLASAENMISRYKQMLSPPPLALASVNLTARKPNKKTPDSNPYLRKWIKRRKLVPEIAAAFAGRLDYPDYGWLDRNIIRLIMTITGGVTDPSARIEYTDWDEVDEFANKMVCFLSKEAI